MLIKVKVYPNSKKEEIIKKSDDSFEIKVRAEAKRGEANKEVIEILSSYFNISDSKIRLIKGFKERSKIFEINL
ncbi:MAG TPA: DUF167 domain-containing protein, partial [Candidatus Pacearchaeota archaeon]|nr:DUF167 domain-containing protein [Candidatus Pacearchaeota archaeon]